VKDLPRVDIALFNIIEERTIMTSIQFTEADRDERGFVKSPARSLADLLPEPSTPAKPPTAKPISRQELLSAGVVALLLLLALLYISSGQPAAPAQQHAPAMIAAAPIAHPTPQATIAPVRMLDAFAAPEGLRLGAIEATRAITPVAHFGADWIQADVQGSGRIWLRKRDWPSLAITGDNLEIAPVSAAAPDMAAVDSATPAQEEPRTGTKPADDRALAHALAVQQERAQHDSGRGNAAVQQQATDTAPEPSYIANVGQQAPHSPRGGLCGPTSGDCAPVPTAAPDMLIIIGQQTPHKVR
jgi:hypothetical protein